MTGIMRNVSVYVLTCLVACAVAGCAGRGGRDGPPNVVIITMDTVRADHLGCYGYAIDTTPRVDELAARSTRYERVVASSSWTVPTHASFFTGKFAFEHGAHGFRVTDREDNAYPLPDGELTLAEVFWDERYATGAFVANDAFLGARWQLNQGFETYHVERAPGDELNERVFAWLDAVSRRPFFLFVNYMDAHNPYIPPAPYDTMFPGKDDTFTSVDYGRLLWAVMRRGHRDISEPERAHLTSQYDGEIAYEDSQIGLLLQRLRDLGLYDNTLIVITSDHGEAHGDRSLLNHGVSVYQDQVSVPLIIKFPHDDRGAVVDTWTGSVDLLPTALDVLGLPVPDHVVGVSLAGSGPPPDRIVVSESFPTGSASHFARTERALFSGTHKLVRSDKGKRELYDLARDADETVNLFDDGDDVARALEERLDDWLETTEERSDTSQVELDTEMRERLKALGYVD